MKIDPKKHGRSLTIIVAALLTLLFIIPSPDAEAFTDFQPVFVYNGHSVSDLTFDYVAGEIAGPSIYIYEYYYGSLIPITSGLTISTISGSLPPGITYEFVPGGSYRRSYMYFTGSVTTPEVYHFTLQASFVPWAGYPPVETTCDFTITVHPHISRVKPAAGFAGMTVAIEGAGFTGTTKVQFGDADASFTVNSDTQITATAPPGSETVNIYITANDIRNLPSYLGEFTYYNPLGKCPYCLFGRGSVNLSTGNFIHEETDFSLPSVGPPLEFTRFYNSQDDYLGPQGKGWTSNLNTHLTVNWENGDISVAYADGHTYTFTASGFIPAQPCFAGSQQADSSKAINPEATVDEPTSSDLPTYAAPPGCYETLTANPDSTYTLTFKNHTRHTFNSSGRLTSITDQNNNHLALAYDVYDRLASATDQLGRSLTFSYDSGGRLAGVTDPINRTVTYTYDTEGNLETVQDANDGITRYQYDDHGLTAVIQPNGNTILTNAYDGSNRIATQTDGNNNTWTYTYTPDQRTLLTAPLGETTTCAHDDRYRSVSVTDPLGGRTAYAYDDNNNRTGVTDPLNNTTQYTYDTSGNTTSSTDASGQTTYTYDHNNNLTAATDPAGRTTTYTYDQSNNLIGVTEPIPAPNTTTFAYDANGRLLSRTSPGGGTTTYTYDNSTGQLHTITDPDGVATTYDHDMAGRLRSVTDSAGATTTYTCDSAGNLLSITDPLGHTTTYTYDQNNNRTTRTDPGGNTTYYTYDDNNLLKSKEDPLQSATIYTYDRESHLIKVTDPNGHDTTYTYDANGRRTGVTDALGNTTGITYDPAGNITAVTDAYGAAITTYGYDALYNITTITDGAGATTTYSYDNRSQNLSAITDPNSHTTSYTHDTLNRLTGATDPLSGQASQGFDPDGNRASLTDPNQNQTTYQYDSAGRLTATVLPTGKSLHYTYDQRGLLASSTNARGQLTTYQYDQAGRLTSVTDPAGAISYTYDENSNLLAVTDETGAITREYDPLNRVTSYTDPRGATIGYQYDNAGNLITLTYPGGRQVHYAYDEADRLTSVTDWAGRVTTYEYDNNSRLIRTTWPDGSIQTITYDDAGRLQEQTDTGQNGQVISQYGLSYDNTGNITEEETATPTEFFTPSNAVIVYDTQDNRATSYNGQPIAYDDDGNMTTGPLNNQMTSYSFDARNRLTNAGDTTYTYDAGNNRISLTTSASQTSYVINPEASLSQVLIKTDAGGAQTYYIYGIGLIGQETGDTYLTYHFDYRGNTVALTDASGGITDRFQYGPYGELQHHTGSTSTPFLFEGRDGVMTDSNGLLYMRARYYSPETGRFISRDSVTGTVASPQTLNSYSYGGNNPVNNTDPNGNTVWTNIVFGLGWATGTLNTDYWNNIYYDPNSVETTEMRKSPGAARLRAAFYAGGCKNITGFEYGSFTALDEMVIDFKKLKFGDWSSTAVQVGGFADAKAINNGDGTVTFIIPNVAGLNSLLLHKVPDSPFSFGPAHNVLQYFYWTEPINGSQ